MSRIMFNPDKDIEILSEYGFSRCRNGAWSITEEIDGYRVYELYITPTHKYIQINFYNREDFIGYTVIADSLQHLIYNLTKEGILIEEERYIDESEDMV